MFLSSFSCHHWITSCFLIFVTLIGKMDIGVNLVLSKHFLNDSSLIFIYLIIGEFDHLFQAFANFSCKGPDGKYFRLYRPLGLCWTYLTESSRQDSFHRQYVSEYLRLCFSMHRNRQQPDLAQRQLIYSYIWWLFKILLWTASLYPLYLS